MDNYDAADQCDPRLNPVMDSVRLERQKKVVEKGFGNRVVEVGQGCVEPSVTLQDVPKATVQIKFEGSEVCEISNLISRLIRSRFYPRCKRVGQTLPVVLGRGTTNQRCGTVVEAAKVAAEWRSTESVMDGNVLTYYKVRGGERHDRDRYSSPADGLLSIRKHPKCLGILTCGPKRLSLSHDDEHGTRRILYQVIFSQHQTTTSMPRRRQLP